MCFFLGCYSYITDISTPKSRTKRLAFLDGLFPIGFFTGMALSGFMKKELGYIPHFGIAMGCAIAAMLWALVILKDSRKMRPPEALDGVEALLKMRGLGGAAKGEEPGGDDIAKKMLKGPGEDEEEAAE